VEPLSLNEAKKQLEIAESDNSHDEHLMRVIGSAREQFEHDTDSAMCFQTWKVVTKQIKDKMVLPKRPIHSITSITYYDAFNNTSTLSTSIYQLDAGKRQIRLAYLQDWPNSVDRWDAWTINYRIGYSVDGRSVPSIAKQAMLLLVGHYFENRDMIVDSVRSDEASHMRAYESLVRRYMRSSYP
jgi:uncharacterized phiE125 gp8 family phage protein